MRFKFSIALFFSLLSGATFAQVNYSISPSNSLNITVVFNQTTASKIYQVNTGSSKISLKWKRVLENLPVGWVYTSCDYGACYGGVPLGPTTMDSIPIGGQGFLGLDIDPGSIVGIGIVKLYVYQDGYQSSGDTLTWNVTSSAVGIMEIRGNEGIKIYPNPATDLLHINFDADKTISSAYLTDNMGRKIKLLEISETTNVINISDLNIGYYNLVLETKDGIRYKKILKTN